jgi:hypothetical protein
MREGGVTVIELAVKGGQDAKGTLESLEKMPAWVGAIMEREGDQLVLEHK